MPTKSKPKFNSWSKPSKENILQEYNVEYKNHMKYNFGNIFPSFKSWNEAIKSGKVKSIPKSKKGILNNFSDSISIKSLISLIKTYNSYPEFRNETTIKELQNRFLNNKKIFMPLIYKDKDGSLHVVAGNTRLSIAYILGITPKVIIFTLKQ